MSPEDTIRKRERLILDLSRILFGDSYDEAIDRAKDMARDESIWNNKRDKDAPFDD